MAEWEATMTFRTATALAAALIASTLSARADDITVVVNVEGYSEADAITALNTFRQNCRPLGDQFWNDVTEARVEVDEETANHRLSRGWKANVHLALKYADNPQVGPATASEAGVLAGHTLHYDLGGGQTPGFLASKRSSQYLCGLAVDPNGGDVFASVPALKFLDRE
jgi:hypothetical protein